MTNEPLVATDETILDYSGWSWKYANTPRAERPDPIEDLFAMLAEHPLDRRFAAYGNFRSGPYEARDLLRSDDDRRPDERVEAAVGKLHYHGNFHTYSYAFSLWTTDPALIERLDAAIAVNIRRDDYLDQHDPVPAAMQALRRETETLKREVESYRRDLAEAGITRTDPGTSSSAPVEVPDEHPLPR